MKIMNAAQSLINNLQINGIQYIFGIPGEENLALMDAIRNSSIKFIPTRHEANAGFMAATVGRLTGKPGVALSTLGPGATNLITGCAYAQHGGMPMIAITAQKPLGKDHEGRFQLLDVGKLMEGVSKYTVRISDPKETPFVIADAYKRSVTERPGVVHIELPEDVSEMDVGSDIEIKYKPIRRPNVDEKALEHMGKLYNDSEAPLIMIGAGANRYRISNELNKMIENYKLHFFTTQMGKGVANELSEYYLGCAHTPQAESIQKAVKNSDLLMVIGHDNYEKSPILLSNDKLKIVNINFVQSDISSVYASSLDLVGDITKTLERMVEYFDLVPKDVDHFEELAKWNRSNIQNGDVGGNKDLHEVVKHLKEVMGSEDILCLDNGYYKLEVAKHFPATNPNTVLLDNALATMGAGLPSAIATKLLYPDKNVVVLVGDGGLMMSISELETAVRLGLSLSIVVLNDNSFGMIRKKQELLGYERFGVDISNPDFGLLFKSFDRSIKGVELDDILNGSENGGINFSVVNIKY